MNILPQFRKTYIYGLIDPRTHGVRYVGKADNPQKRLIRHLSPASRNKNTHKNNWLNELITAGLKPILTILEETTDQDWGAVEQKWIDEGRRNGWALTNQADGGRGQGVRRGSRNSPEALHTMAEKLRGRKRPPELVEKTAAALRGRKRPPEVGAKISAARKGMKFTGEALENIRAARSRQQGRKLSKSTKGKIGESHTKLTALQAEQIRAYARNGLRTQKQMAEMYGVSVSTIASVVNRRQKHAYREG